MKYFFKPTGKALFTLVNRILISILTIGLGYVNILLLAPIVYPNIFLIFLLSYFITIIELIAVKIYIDAKEVFLDD